MILKNLFRRKIRTLLTVLGISMGVAAIIALGAMSSGLKTGYNSILQGSRADLVLSQPNTFDISYSTVDEKIGEQLSAMPEVAEVSGMVQGIVQSENAPYFFIFGYPADSFSLQRFQIIRGMGLSDRMVARQHGKPVLIGSAAAESLKKDVGDTLRLTGSAYRVVGIYQTGDAFEDSGAVLDLREAQNLLAKPRQVSVFFVRLKDPALGERLITRVERMWDDYSLSSTSDFSNQQILADSLNAYVWVIAGLAIVLGGVGMMNAQLMSVFERTREIGVLRAVGWTRRQVLWMILGETIIVCLIGGVVGIALGWGLIILLSQVTVLFGANPASISVNLLAQAIITVLVLGVVGGLYPARRAAGLQPIEALRYEGGSSGSRVRRLPFGGMALQGLWQRSTRSVLTLAVIAITVGSIMALEAVLQGTAQTMTEFAAGARAEIMIRQSNVSDTSLSAIDERISERLAALPKVEAVSGIMFSAVVLPENAGFLIIQGYRPGDYALSRFKIISGEPLTNNRQLILGKTMSDALKKAPGDVMEINGVRFRVAGVYETGVGWEELGAVLTLRDAQTLMGRPRQVTMLAVKMRDPARAEAMVDQINTQFPDVYAALSGDFVEKMPDMEAADAMLQGLSILSIIVGGLGVMNTMLMAVMERTREIGVLRALGWRRRFVLDLIIRESLLLAIIGGSAGMIMAPVLVGLLSLAPMVGEALEPVWSAGIFARAFLVAVFLGLMGGIYPAYRATRLQPVEALRYE